MSENGLWLSAVKSYGTFTGSNVCMQTTFASARSCIG